MAISEKAQKTYSFRAPSDFAERIRLARAALPKIFASVDETNHFTHEFEIAVLRRTRRLPETPGQTEFVRAITEAFVSTVERVLREPELMEQMRAFDRENTEGDAWRRGALLARARAGFDD
jgi:hypothetical protein